MGNAVSVMLAILLLLSEPMQAYGDDNRSTRFGVMFLGTGFLSGMIEQRWGDTGARLTIGVFDTELCISTAVTRSFGNASVRPFAGIGVWNVLIFPEGRPGGLFFLSAPLGADWRISGPHHLGAEADLHYFFTGRNPDGSPVDFNEEHRFMPLPGTWYAYSGADSK